MRKITYIIIAVLWVSVISACGLVIPSSDPTSLPSQEPEPSHTAAQIVPQQLDITPTPEFTATATIIPTATPSPTFTFTPTPTPHPMSIVGMRQGSYPGSEIQIERELDPGANYRRYYAAYRSEGLKIYALLTIPNGTPPEGGWPAIVFNHGYIPPTVYRTTERYVAYVDWLARNGFVVFRIDYRGHDQSEGQPRGAYSDPGYTVDVLNAVSSIRQFPQVNPEKIGMWGHSMGGFLTLRAMVISPDIKVGVIWGGVIVSYPDMITRWRRTTGGAMPTPSSGGGGWRQGWLNQYGSWEENPEFWDSVSANAFLSDISGPVQLHHGTADESVPVTFSEILFSELLAEGKMVELYKYEGDNHNISNSFGPAMTRSIDFFNRYLK